MCSVINERTLSHAQAAATPWPKLLLFAIINGFVRGAALISDIAHGGKEFTFSRARIEEIHLASARSPLGVEVAWQLKASI